MKNKKICPKCRGTEFNYIVVIPETTSDTIKLYVDYVDRRLNIMIGVVKVYLTNKIKNYSKIKKERD